MKKHLDEVGMTYLQHMARAWKYAFKLLLAALAGFIHGILPNLFETTASDTVKRLGPKN